MRKDRWFQILKLFSKRCDFWTFSNLRKVLKDNCLQNSTDFHKLNCFKILVFFSKTFFLKELIYFSKTHLLQKPHLLFKNSSTSKHSSTSQKLIYFKKLIYFWKTHLLQKLIYFSKTHLLQKTHLLLKNSTHFLERCWQIWRPFFVRRNIFKKQSQVFFTLEVKMEEEKRKRLFWTLIWCSSFFGKWFEAKHKKKQKKQSNKYRDPSQQLFTRRTCHISTRIFSTTKNLTATSMNE